MTVAIARVTLFIGGSHSLKEKRMVLRRVKDLVRGKFNAAIAEVGEQDMWQRAVLGITLVGNERKFVEEALDEVLRFVRSHANGAEVTDEEREIQTFAEGPGGLVGSGWKHWEG